MLVKEDTETRVLYLPPVYPKDQSVFGVVSTYVLRASLCFFFFFFFLYINKCITTYIITDSHRVILISLRNKKEKTRGEVIGKSRKREITEVEDEEIIRERFN